MNKLAKKLSVFALSSVMLLANSKAGMFAEGQTYDLGEVGTVNIRNYDINNDGSVESFDVYIKDLELDIDVYRENDGIAYALRNAGTVVSSGTIEHCEDFRNAEYVLKILIERITKKNLPTLPRLIPRTPESSMTTIETSVMDEPQKTPKHTKQKQKKKDKFVEEKKPKKINPTKHRKTTYKLKRVTKYDYEHGHCTCREPASHRVHKIFQTKIGGNQTHMNFYACPTCKRPIRQTHKNNKSCCWKTYCTECERENEFYMERGTGDKCILICCSAYPFKLHKIEYASTAKFNKAVDHKHVKYICSNPKHTRGHAYKGKRRGSKCLDCMKAYNVAYYQKKHQITLLLD